MTAPVGPVAAVPAGWTLPRLLITRDGEWLHEGEEVTHPGILANLRESLKVDDEGHYLVAGPARVPVELEDAPFVVVRVAVEGDRLVATLNDLSREPLDPVTLSFDGEGVPHCRVKGGRFSARLSRAATCQLLGLAEDGEAEGQAVLLVGSRRYSIALPPLGAPPPDPPPAGEAPKTRG